MKKIPILFAACFAAAVAILPTDTAIAGLVACDGITVQCNMCTLMETLRNVFQFILVIAAILAAGVIMYGGFKMVSSAGSESGYQDGKKYVYNSILGLIILMGAFTIVDVVLQTLVADTRVGNLTTVWERVSDCGGMSSTRTGSPEDIDEDDTVIPEDGEGGENPTDPIDLPPNNCQGNPSCLASLCANEEGVWDPLSGQCMPPTGSGTTDPTDPPINPPVGCQGVLIQGICYGEVITNATTQTSCAVYGGYFSNGVCYRATSGGETPTEPTTPNPPVEPTTTTVTLTCDSNLLGFRDCSVQVDYCERILEGIADVNGIINGTVVCSVLNSVDGPQ